MGDSNITVIAEIGTCWRPGDMASLRDACKAALDCGADLVKVQCFDARLLSMRRNVRPQDLSGWDLMWGDVLDCVTENDRIGASFFHWKHVLDLWGHMSTLLPAFLKSACQEWQNAELAEAFGQVSDACDLPLYVSVPPDATLSVGNYYGKQPITWMYCVPEYPAPKSNYHPSRVDQMARRLPGKVGISSHAPGREWLEASKDLGKQLRLRGVTAWEAHFCYDEKLRGQCPDGGPWSLSREDFEKVAEKVRA